MERVQKLRDLLHERGIDCALITALPNIRYFSGFTNVECTVLITKQRSILYTDFRYTIQAKEEASGFEIIEARGSGVIDGIRAVISEEGCRTCAFEEDAMYVGRFKEYEQLGLEFIGLGAQISRLRVIKSEHEIRCLQTAQKMADDSLKLLLDRLQIGMTEREVAAELTYLGSKLGSEGPSFDVIVGSGPNGAMCHAVPTDRKISDGDLVVIDFGCIYGGYHSDMTRTIGFGNVSEECRHIYDIVLKAHNAALAAVRPGITGKELDSVARDIIVSNGYGDRFGHSLGHGFGLEIHEAPSASQRSADVILQPGMTITIEPGIYVEGLAGVRIEDCCVVTENGCLDLVHFPKELIIVK